MKIRNYLALLSLALIAITCFTSLEAKISRKSRHTRMSKVQKAHKAHKAHKVHKVHKAHMREVYEINDKIPVPKILNNPKLSPDRMRHAIAFAKFAAKQAAHSDAVKDMGNGDWEKLRKKEAQEEDEKEALKRSNPITGIEDPRKSLSKTFSFMSGMIQAISGADPKQFIDRCVPDTVLKQMQIVDKNEEASGTTEKSVGKEGSSVWTEIADNLGNAINVVCSIKSEIYTWITTNITSRRRLIRRNRRLFLAGKKRRARRSLARGSIKTLFNDAKDWLQDNKDELIRGARDFIAGPLKRSMQAGKDYALEQIGEVKKFIQETINTVMKQIWEKFNGLKQKLDNFLNSEVVQQAKTFLDCVKTGFTNLKSVVSTIGTFLGHLAMLVHPIGWAKLFFNWICGWESLKSAIQNFKKAWNETNPSKKWDFYGQSFGYLVVATAG